MQHQQQYHQQQYQQQYQQQHRQQPPFRVLSPAGRISHLEGQPLSPPPARAPEPYKLVAAATGYGRAQRKSSFAIIAETRPPTPRGLGESQSSSPGSPQPPSSGRLSPFRGRGFKGPPPRSRSRPRTPPTGESRRKPRSRIERTLSTSQQNSPKRSQIPRPTRSRSISSSKENEETHKASPKFGRRAVNKYTSSVGNGLVNHRRLPRKETKTRPELSPIKGTPTKPRTDNNKNHNASSKATPRNGGAQMTIDKSPEKFNRNLLAPSKILPNNKRFVTAKNSTPRDKTSSADVPDSPSRIPLRKASPCASNSNSTNSLIKPSSTETTASITYKDKPTSHSQNQNQSVNNRDDSKSISSNNKKSSLSNGYPQSTADADLTLVDLLKQSSSATGTSSVVNTTTTTAVQPLQIDAASILAESELVAKLANLEKKQKSLEMREKSIQEAQKLTATKKTTETESKTCSNKNNGGETMKTDYNDEKMRNVENDGQNNNTAMVKNSSSSDGKTTSSLGSASNNQDKKIRENLIKRTAQAEGDKSTEDTTKRFTEEAEGQRQGVTRSLADGKPEGKASNAKATVKSTTSDTTNDSQKVSPSSRKKSARNGLADGGDDKSGRGNYRATKSNEVSLESQARTVSSESLGSLRSNDTGVSLNTVRGVSSAKEKSGLHFVKRPEEIETLSGNIVKIDRNGAENAATDRGAEPGVEGPRTRTRWRRLAEGGGCWKRLVPGKSRAAERKERPEKEQREAGQGRTGCCSCWPKMRCLACRRDPKPRLWPGKRARAASSMHLAAAESPTDKPPGKWARFKDACRCRTSSGESRWCGWRRSRAQRHRQRVAPAADESKPGCCSSERGPVGLCRRLFAPCGFCPCNGSANRRGSDQSRRTKSLRAKHSLTSVAAPPLSEETRPKIPDVLVEHNSVMRGAIPCLPLPVAWLCLICNVLLPGSGTVLSGLFNLCLGQPRFSATASPKARFGALVVDVLVGISQLFTVLFCLVGWGWSIWWGVTMVRLARKYKRFKDSEAAANDPEARAAAEPATLPAPGVPTQALRAAERPR